MPISYFFFFSSFKQVLGWLMVEVGKKSHKLFDPNMGKQKKKTFFFPVDRLTKSFSEAVCLY